MSATRRLLVPVLEFTAVSTPGFSGGRSRTRSAADNDERQRRRSLPCWLWVRCQFSAWLPAHPEPAQNANTKETQFEIIPASGDQAARTSTWPRSARWSTSRRAALWPARPRGILAPWPRGTLAGLAARRPGPLAARHSGPLAAWHSGP